MKIQHSLWMKIILYCLISLSVTSVACSQSKNISVSNPPAISSTANQPTQAESKQSVPNTDVSLSRKIGVELNENDIAKTGQKIEDFAPKGWYLMGKAEGDLNGDGIADAVAAFSKAKLFDGKTDSTHFLYQSEVDVETDRVLVIALGDKQQQLNLDLFTQNVILCRSCGGWLGDSFGSLKIAGNIIELRQNALGTSSVDYLYRIKYDPRKDWIVFERREEATDRSNSKTKSYKSSKPISLKDFDIKRDSLIKETFNRTRN